MASPRTRSSRSSKDYTEVQIGRYTRMDHIGKGSFATVYRGMHTKSRTFVAIKSVNLAKLNKKLKDNLAMEIDILKGLIHPHIVALLDCLETSSHIHLIMEYCALGDLSQFIKRRDSLKDHSYTRHMMTKYPNIPGQALNEVVVRHFLKQLASALKFLRGKNLIHRDIKPQNLLLCLAPVTAEADPQIVPLKGSEYSFTPATGLNSLPLLKLADFGFARSLPATSLAETLCGSPLYMAPEILRYEKYDAKADLWSVGTVLYEMVVGRPPFRAVNHVELLQKIETSRDQIKFPKENPASDEIKALIRALLKCNPVIRMSFADFFENIVITGPIPGLAAEDEATPAHQSPELPADEPQQPRSSIENTPDRRSNKSPVDDIVRYPPPHRYVPHNERPENSGASTPMRRTRSGDKPSAAKPIPTAATPQRPEAVSLATAPGRQELVDRNTIERVKSQQASGHKTSEAVRNERETAAQDVAFERDYVVVEKRAVEVNAFADAMAHDAGAQDKHTGALPRRQTTPAIPTTTTSPQSSLSKAVQIAPGRARADSGHNRVPSYERRYGQSPTSATSAISKALHKASGRLFGVGYSPPLNLTKGGRSPPLAYNPFSAYPTPYAGLLTSGDGAMPQASPDEGTKLVKELEERASRSDVVYGFAEVKYQQLVPATPSAPTDNSPNIPVDIGDIELTADAIVTLSEEGLVLYVKVLSLLAKSMEIARVWWSRKYRGGSLADPSFSRLDPVSIRINKVVQWVRNRFNEVVTKADVVRAKLVEAQRQLPPDHPSHPNNLSLGSAGSATSADVMVTPGVTAERLMYDRAVELSKGAAINELMSHNLDECEIAYISAIRMLEAVLEADEVPGSGPNGDMIVSDGLEDKSREVVVKLVNSIRARLTNFQRRLAILATTRHTPPPSGKMLPSNLAHATGVSSPR